ncbi:MAG: glycoside hydrolase [Tannerella sp.]|nr:glycoside hydrolase [Tannerella sp.]
MLLSAQKLNLHPVPQQMVYALHNDDFTVLVRLHGEKEWRDLYEYRVHVDMDTKSEASMVQFDFEGKVDLCVKVNNGMVYDVKIRPLSRNIQHTVERNIIYFSLDKPAKLSLEVNGDRLHNLHIFANPPETEIPSPDDLDVIYFGEGVHRPKDLPGNSFTIASGKTVYLAPGAIVQGKFICNRAENVRFIGRGIIFNAQRGFEVTHAKNVEIDGITVINPDHYTVFGGETDGLTVKNLNSFSNKGWSDGIDLMSCSNVLIDNVFMRNSDDCIALYAHRWNFYGDARNITVQNSVLWADIAHPVNMGGHGNYNREPGDTLEDITFRNIDILEHDEDDRAYQGCMSISVGDRNLVRRVLFEDIRVENIQEGCLFTVKVHYNDKYDHEPGRGVEAVTFRHITYNGIGENPSAIRGYDAQRTVKNITFENIMINGKKVTTFDEMNLKMEDYVQNIQIK